MKKIVFLLLIILIASFQTYAQKGAKVYYLNLESSSLKSGKYTTATFEITPEELSSFDTYQHKKIVEPEIFKISIGGSSTNFKTVKLEVTN